MLTDEQIDQYLNPPPKPDVSVAGLVAVASGEEQAFMNDPDTYINTYKDKADTLVKEMLQESADVGLATARDIVSNIPDPQVAADMLKMQARSQFVTDISEADAAYLKLMQNETDEAGINRYAQSINDVSFSDPAAKVRSKVAKLQAKVGFTADLLDKAAGGFGQTNPVAGAVATGLEYGYELFTGFPGTEAFEAVGNTLDAFGVEKSFTDTPSQRFDKLRVLLRDEKDPVRFEKIIDTLLSNAYQIVQRGGQTSAELQLVLESALGQDYSLETSGTLMSALENVGTVLEPLIVAGPLKVAGRAIGRLARTSPATAGRVSKEILNTGNPLAIRAMQTTTTEPAVKFGITKTADDIIDVGPDITDAAAATAVRTPADLLEASVTPSIRRAAATRITDAIRNTVGSLHPSKSKIDVKLDVKTGAETVEYKAVYADTPNSGFAELSDALHVYNNLKENNPKSVVNILFRDKSGNLVEVPENVHGMFDTKFLNSPAAKGEFFIQETNKRFYNIADYGGEDYTGFVTEIGRKFSTAFRFGQFGKEFDQFVNSFSVFIGQESKRMFDILKGPIAALGKDSKAYQQFNEYFNKQRRFGDSVRKELTDAELKAEGYSNTAIEAIKAYRRYKAEEFKLIQEKHYTQVWAAGGVGVKARVGDVDTVVAAYKRDLIPANVAEAIDSGTGLPTKITPLIRKQLRDGQLQAFKLHRAAEVDGGKFNYMFAPKGQITDLPLKLVDDVVEHVPRFLRATDFIIQTRPTMVDGVLRTAGDPEVEVVVKASLGRKTAEDWIKTRKNPADYRVVTAREYLLSKSRGRTLDEAAQELVAEASRVDRGPVVLGDLEDTVDVLDALQHTNYQALKGAYDDKLSAALILNWDSRFAGKWADKDQRIKIPKFRFGEDLPSVTYPTPELLHAKTIAAHINLIAGTNKAGLEAFTRKFAWKVADRVIRLGEWTERTKIPGGKKAGFKIKRAGTSIADVRSPVEAMAPLQRAATALWVSWRFAKQWTQVPGSLYLHALQPGALTHMANPAGYFAELTGALSAKMGVGSSTLLEQFEKSAIAELINQNQLLSAIKLDAAPISELARSSIKYPIQKLNNIGRQIGLGATEWLNKLSAFSIARANYAKAAGKSVDDLNDVDIQKIAAEAEVITLRQNRLNTLGTQKGGLGVLYQFSGNVMRAAGRLLPRWDEKGKLLEFGPVGQFVSEMGKIGDPSLSNTRKAAGLAGILYLWGTDGIADFATRMTEDAIRLAGVEIDDETRLKIQNGHLAMLLAYADPGTLVASSDTSPIGGGLDTIFFPFVSSAKLFHNIAIDGPSLVAISEALADSVPLPAARVVQNFGEATLGAYQIAFGRPAELMTAPEQVKATAKTIQRIIPTLSDIDRFLMSRAYGKIYSRLGSPIAQATATETWVQLLGLRSLKADNLYAAERQLGQRIQVDLKGLEGIAEKKGIDDARFVMQAMVQTAGITDTFVERTPEDVYEEMLARIGLARLGFDEQEDTVYKDAFIRELGKIASREDRNTTIAERLYKPWVAGKMPTDFISHVKAFPPSPMRTKLLEAMDAKTAGYDYVDEQELN